MIFRLYPGHVRDFLAQYLCGKGISWCKRVPISPPLTGSLTGFELAVEDEGGIGEFLFGQAELGAKEYLGRPAPGQSHEAQQPWRKDTGVKTHEGPKRSTNK